MRLIILTILLQIIYSCNFAQLNVMFEFINECSNEIDSTEIIVYDEPGKMYYLNDECNCFELEPNKKYFYCAGFYRNHIEYGSSLVYIPFITKSKDTTITVHTYKLEKGSKSYSVWDLKYYYCDELCNGRYTDYYKNGQKRLKGKFKKGFHVGKLYYYNKMGTLIKTERYNRKGELKKTVKNE